jgi:hypothetical protein
MSHTTKPVHNAKNILRIIMRSKYTVNINLNLNLIHWSNFGLASERVKRFFAKHNISYIEKTYFERLYDVFVNIMLKII